MTNALRLSYPLLAGSVFARQLCLPFPAVLFLVTAGTLVSEGKLNVAGVLCVSVIGCLAGDLIWFEAGRRWGSQIMRIFAGFSDDPQRSSARARSIFSKWGLWSLLVAKLIPGLDGITPPLAGLEGVSRFKFIIYDAAGALVWSLLYVACGLVFAGRIQVILAALSRFSDVLLICIGVPLLLFIAWRAASILRMIQRLKMRRISPSLLKSKLESGEQVVVVDLLNYEETALSIYGIPGAVRIDPARLRNRSRISAPEDLQIVLYCSSSGAFRSARVAIALKRKGVSRVWILEGGLMSWIEAGFPMSDRFSTENEIISKFGLRILDRELIETTDTKPTVPFQLTKEQ